jgi:hypothetical protein
MNRKRALLLGTAGLSLVLAVPLVFAQQAVPGNKNILIVCGDENGTVDLCTSIDDIALKNRLEMNMGHRVTMIPHDADAAELLAAADAADLVIIVESVNSGAVGTDLVTTATPIISSEAFLQDEFGLVVGPFVAPDPGYPGGPTETQLRAFAAVLQGVGLRLNIDVPPTPPPAAGEPARTPQQQTQADNQAYNAARNAAIAAAVAGIAAKPTHGVTINQLDVVITDPAHPLAAGLSGRVQVYRANREMNWGVALAPGAQIVATLAPSLEAAGDTGANVAADYSTAATVYFVPQGGELAGGATAAGLRIQYFVENENGPGTYNLMTEDGFRLFDAAINWALSNPTGM